MTSVPVSTCSGHVQSLQGLEISPSETFFKSVHSALFGESKHGQGLADYLKEQGITELVISGIRTEQCCETTTRHASDLGFKVRFVPGATLTFPMTSSSGRTFSPAEIKERTELVLTGRFADVVTAERALASLESRKSPKTENAPFAKTHHYQARCAWTGSTGVGYEAYSRAHEASASPSAAQVQLSSDPAFHGDPALLNPEQLLVMSAASCQLLSFLAVAARARLNVGEYRDDAEGFIPENERPLRLTRVTLRPRILVERGAGVTEERVLNLAHVAHHECFIANSFKTEVVVEPTVELVARGQT